MSVELLSDRRAKVTRGASIWYVRVKVPFIAGDNPWDEPKQMGVYEVERDDMRENFESHVDLRDFCMSISSTGGPPAPPHLSVPPSAFINLVGQTPMKPGGTP